MEPLPANVRPLMLHTLETLATAWDEGAAAEVEVSWQPSVALPGSHWARPPGVGYRRAPESRGQLRVGPCTVGWKAVPQTRPRPGSRTVAPPLLTHPEVLDVGGYAGMPTLEGLVVVGPALGQCPTDVAQTVADATDRGGPDAVPRVLRWLQRCLRSG